MKSLVDRFFRGAEIRRLSECWPWRGATNYRYGVVGVGSPSPRNLYAHRVSWMLDNNQPVPEGLCILHSCDNKLCVNPSHLHLGTNAENMKEMRERKQGKRRKLTAAQVKEIRVLILQDVTRLAIAKRFGVTHTTIYDIEYGRSWKP